MDIAVIGAGPAGLHAAILLKLRAPSARIRVFERNPPHATYGFGVVFSDRALDFLKSDDPGSHDLLLPHMEVWQDLTVTHRGRAIAIDGNGFAAIGRLRLLDCLSARAEGLGVELVHDCEILNPDGLAGSDLIICADGINSAMRDAAGSDFGTRIERLTNRFAWYGVALPFDTLSLTFRPGHGGVFVAHHYRYEPGMSTFLVECDEATYNTAGLGDMDEAASRAICEDVFAPDLAGRPLVSNATAWRQFPLLRNAQWHNGRMVLIGDALRSAHFSIGSGTRLAMEDAIALAKALEEADFDITSGLEAYEAARRPVVDKMTDAAAASARWYEDMAAHMALSPYDFAHAYMTRTGRVSDERMQRAAPRFMAAYEKEVSGKGRRRG